MRECAPATAAAEPNFITIWLYIPHFRWERKRGEEEEEEEDEKCQVACLILHAFAAGERERERKRRWVVLHGWWHGTLDSYWKKTTFLYNQDYSKKGEKEGVKKVNNEWKPMMMMSSLF